jgi:hypothetical protein
MGTKQVLHRTHMLSWGCDTALYQTLEAMRVELPSRLAAGPRVIKRNRGNGGQGVEPLASPRNRPMVRVLDDTKEASEEVAPLMPLREISVAWIAGEPSSPRWARRRAAVQAG